jgi:penicillin-binding protein A
VPDATYLAGYYNPVRYGTSNLESAYNDELSGRNDADPAKQLEWSLLHQPAQGNDLLLTLNASLQQQATNLLGGRNGSIVLLDAKTGAVLAMVSNPHLDPAGLADAPGNDPATYWDTLRNDPASPFVLRPTQGLYTPGSIFKTITAAAAIDTGKARPDTKYEDRGFYNIEGFQLQEQNIPKGREAQQSWTLAEGYQWSLNVVFAQVGAQTLGGPTLADYAKRFGFGEQIPFDLGTNASRISDSPNFLQSGPAVAQTAFGQGQLLATPLQMALVAACMANDGKEMTPYLVSAVRRPDGTIASQHTPTVWKEPIRAETAVQMRAIMENSVANGYANTAAIPGVVTGGKTGTAEVPNGQPHAWYIGYAPGKNTSYAIAVLVENGGEGSTVAAPMAKQMLQAVLAYDAKK